MKSRRFAVVVASAERGKLLVPIPFDPDQVWGAKQRHHVAGTVNGVRVRAVIEPAGDGFGFTLGRPRLPATRSPPATRSGWRSHRKGPTRRPRRRRRRSPGGQPGRRGVLRLARAVLSPGISALDRRDQTPTRTTRRTHRRNGETARIRRQGTAPLRRHVAEQQHGDPDQHHDGRPVRQGPHSPWSATTWVRGHGRVDHHLVQVPRRRSGLSRSPPR